MDRGRLLGSLGRYAPSEPAEIESLGRIRRFLGSSEDPFSRANPEGHITGSAVVARPDGSAFLFLLHRKLGRWLQPGGHTEPSDESVFDTALREAREETGIAVFEAPLARAVLDVDVHAIPPHGKDPAHFHFDIRYLFATAGEIDAVAAEDPARPMRWMSFEEALSEGVDASLSRALDKARSRLSRGLQSAGAP